MAAATTKRSHLQATEERAGSAAATTKRSHLQTTEELAGSAGSLLKPQNLPTPQEHHLHQEHPPPNSSQAVLPTGEEIFKGMSLWGHSHSKYPNGDRGGGSDRHSFVWRCDDYSQHLPLQACHRPSSYHFSCPCVEVGCRGFVNAKEQNCAQVVALVLLCQSLTALKTSWCAMPGELVGTLSDAFPELCF